MIVHFGLHADGIDPSAPRTVLGEVRVGPRGLLEMLETDLGLPPVLEHAAAQLARYRSCLADANDLMRFYHASFEVDPIGVSRELMRWRAAWYEAGWDGRFQTREPRLADMAAVETLARESAAPCMGQRLQAIAQALRTRRTQIARLVLLDDPAELPRAWRRVANAIGYEVHPGVFPTPGAPPGTDLARLQTILAGSETTGSGRLEGDDTVLVVRAESRDVSARALAEYIRRVGAAERIVIAERDGIVFDNALERTGLPRCGFQHRSRHRAVTQVPRLVLALLWEPIDPRLLLQFLLHPVAPLPRRVRRPLAGAVAQQPGVGGADWQAAMARIREADAARPETDAAAVTRDIRYWLESPRFSGQTGAPIETVVARTQRCARWVERRRANADELEQGLYTATISQCKALCDSLAQLTDDGGDRIRKAELDRLLDEAALPQADPRGFAQAGHVRGTTHPETLVDPVEEVLWWDLRPPASDLATPWSQAELGALATAGAELPPPGEQLRRRRLGWLRPLLQCRRRLVLVVHRADAGRHPLLAEIEHRCPGFRELRLDDALLDGHQASLPHLRVSTPPLPVTPLQPPRRWWSLPPTVELPPREQESYTSLAKLCDYPHAWVLGYLAKLRPGRAADLHDKALLYGSLAHRLFDRFFREHPQASDWNPSDPALEAWIHATLEQLFETEGAVLLQRGRGADRQYVGERIERGLLDLVGHLRRARIVSVRSELQQEAEHAAFGLRGTIDLLLTSAAGRRAVMDVKWGSEPYHQRQMQAGRHLQLATYAWLHRAADGLDEWPYPSYYIVTTGNVIAPDRSVFPAAIVATPDSVESLDALWKRAEATHAWRRDQFDRGFIEVNVSGTVADERSEAPDDGLASPDGPDRFDDFGLLTGIDPSQ